MEYVAPALILGNSLGVVGIEEGKSLLQSRAAISSLQWMWKQSKNHPLSPPPTNPLPHRFFQQTLTKRLLCQMQHQRLRGLCC